MIRGVLYRQDNRQPVVTEVMQTTNPVERMRGLLGRPPLQDNQGLLIRPCSSVHTFGMRYPIDLIFLNKNGRITKLVHALRPRRLAWSWGAHMVVELPGGTLSQLDLTLNSQLIWEKTTCV